MEFCIKAFYKILTTIKLISTIFNIIFKISWEYTFNKHMCINEHFFVACGLMVSELGYKA